MDGWMIALCIFAGVVLGGAFTVALVAAGMNEFWKELLNK
jgi:hypothetical protein